MQQQQVHQQKQLQAQQHMDRMEVLMQQMTAANAEANKERALTEKKSKQEVALARKETAEAFATIKVLEKKFEDAQKAIKSPARKGIFFSS